MLGLGLGLAVPGGKRRHAEQTGGPGGKRWWPVEGSASAMDGRITCSVVAGGGGRSSVLDPGAERGDGARTRMGPALVSGSGTLSQGSDNLPCMKG